MVLTKRFKLLLAAATAVIIYVVVSAPDNSGTTAAVTRSTSTRSNGVRVATSPGHRNVSSTSGPDASVLLARLSRRVADGKAAPALFHSQSWYVPPPPPPPAPYVMGSYARPGTVTVYFLTRGDRVFDVRVGDTIDSLYSVDGEANGALQLTYKPLNIQQTLPLGGSQ
jgi:hypothetical protein